MAARHSDAAARMEMSSKKSVILRTAMGLWCCTKCDSVTLRQEGADVKPCPCGGSREYVLTVGMDMVTSLDDLFAAHGPQNGGGDDE